MRRILVVIAVLLLVLVAVWGPVRGPDTIVPTPTVTPAPVIAPSGLACAAAPPSRLAADMQTRVPWPARGQVRRNLVVRDAPGGEQIGLMPPGTRFIITGDSVCAADGLRWWPVANDDLAGWSVEGFAPADYLMEPDT
jgi:hypothetical protein